MGIDKYKPGVPKKWRFLLAGALWSAIGLMLCVFAINWVADLPWYFAISLELAGILLAFVGYHFLFAAIAKKNIERIRLSSDIACLFSFQAWPSYFIEIQ